MQRGRRTIIYPQIVVSQCSAFAVMIGAVVITQDVSRDVGLMLGQRRRRWPNIKPTLIQYVQLAG